MEHPASLSPPRVRARSALKRVGFALASVVVGLVLVGQGIFLVRALGSEGSSYAPTARVQGTLMQRLDDVLGAALGASDRGVQRYRVTSIAPDPAHAGLRDVDITWAINDDVAAGSIGNGAQQDVYTVLRDLYTASLPIARVRLTGTYPLARTGGSRDTVAMRLSMDLRTARLIGQVGWDTMDPVTVWPLVTRQWVAPELQPITGG